MKRILILIIILPFFAACRQLSPNTIDTAVTPDSTATNKYTRISEIPLPEGYLRINPGKETFGAWLQGLPLKKSKTVYLYNGLPKKDQSVQYAVLDVPIGNKDLQQCADAIMRLRAEFLYTKHNYSEIIFWDNSNHCYPLGPKSSRRDFDDYLTKVFVHCGTLSLQKQLKPVMKGNDMKIGDVLIKGGSPGHAMIVADMATNKDGKKIYLLAQSYMPAQDIHIVNNPMNGSLSPWYELNKATINTPEWTFEITQLRTW